MSTTQKRSASGCLVFAFTFFVGALLFLVFLLGMGLLIPSVYDARESARLQDSGVQTQASVVTAVSTKCGKNTYGYTYTVQFTDQSGQTHTTTLNCLSSNAAPGKAITVVYLPDDPTFIELPSQVGSARAGNGFLILFSLFLCLIGLIGLIFWVRHGKRTISSMSKKTAPAVSRQPRAAAYNTHFSSTPGTSRIDENRGE